MFNNVFMQTVGDLSQCPDSEAAKRPHAAGWHKDGVNIVVNDQTKIPLKYYNN
jgi:hypothetical protein